MFDEASLWELLNKKELPKSQEDKDKVQEKIAIIPHKSIFAVDS